MKTIHKILIAVGAVVLAAAVIVGVLFAVFSARKVPDLDEEKLYESPINYDNFYIVGQPSYTDRWVFDTQIGMSNYWNKYHRGCNGIEVVLQQSKDGKLIMLSEPLPGKSNADDLYGSDVQVGDLTLEELQKINLAYDFTDEGGFQRYVDMTDERLERVSVVTLDDMLAFYSDPGRISARLFLRFYDESAISDIGAALQTVYDGLKAYDFADKVVFLPQSDEAAKAADTACPELLRAATTAEAKALYRNSKSGKAQDALPYSAIYEKVNGQFGSEGFIHYARNLGLAVILSDVKEDDLPHYRAYGVTAIATDNAESFIQVLKDAEKAEWESQTEAD